MARQISQIEAEIKAELSSGKSMFQVAIGLSEDDRVVILDCKTPEFFPCARVAAWFYDFFENSDGQDYRKSSWDDDAWRIANTCWRSVFPDVELSNDTFKSQCWLLDNKEKGRTSHLWSGIKKCLDLPPDNRFTVEAYDNPPKYMRHLLSAYQRGEASGTDFADFVEAFESGSGEGMWHQALYSACKEKFSDRANLGVYLHWSGGVSCGIGIGIDRIRGSRSSTLYFDGQRKDKPTRNKFYPIEGVKTKVGFSGVKAMVISPAVEGVYYRYVSDMGDARSGWWKQVQSDGVVPFSRDDLLVCCGDGKPCVSSGEFEGAVIEVGERFELRIRNNGEDRACTAFRIKVLERPLNDVVIRLSDERSIVLAGRVPRIVVSAGSVEGLTAGDLTVCAGDCSFGISGAAEGSYCQWRCNDADVGEGVGFKRKEAELGGDSLCHLKINCRIFNADGVRTATLVRHVVWIPLRIAEKLLTCEDVRVPGWRISKSSDKEEIIRDRIRNRVRYNLEAPNCERERIYAPAKGMFFWFARGLADWEEDCNYSEEKLFFVKGDVEGWHLCVPGNVETLEFKIDDKVVKNPESEPINGVWRIPLNKLILDDEGYVYNPDLSLQTLTCNGTIVASVGDAPKHASLCRNQERKWGVYIPESETTAYKAVLYTDNTLDRHFLEPLVVHSLKTDQGGDPFHPLEDMFVELGKSDSVGEWHLALMPDTDAFPELLMLGRFLDAACQVRIVRPNTATYPPDQNLALLKVIQTQLKVPEGHVYAKSRLARYSEALKPNEIGGYWKAFADTGSVESLPDALTRMLKSDYNFLADPRWFFGALNQLLEGRRKKLGLERITSRVNEDVFKMLIDNGDGKEDMFKGLGCCSAILAQKTFESYAELVDARSRYVIREVSRLSSGARAIVNLGLVAELESPSGVDVRLAVLKTHQRSIELDRAFALMYDKRCNAWEIRHNRGGRAVVADGFVFRCFSVDPKKFVRAHYGDFNDVSEAKSILTDEGIGSEALDALKEQTCNMADYLRNGVGAAIRSVLAEVCARSDGWRDAGVVALCGMTIAVQNTVCREGEPMGWPLAKASDSYLTLVQLVRIFFRRKFEDGAPEMWRGLMREIVANMRLLAYLNVTVSNDEE